MVDGKVREMGSKKVASEIIDLTGATSEDFLKANIPTGRELTMEEKIAFLKKKGYAHVVVSVKTLDEKGMSALVDEFNMHISSSKHTDNVTTLKKKLKALEPLVDSLVSNWESEM